MSQRLQNILVNRAQDEVAQPGFAEALRFWWKLGWISFGGTAAHIAIMHEDLVERKEWISNGEFLYALSHCSGFEAET